MSKSNLFYALAVIIGMGLFLSMVTGLVFLLDGSGGYQGGSNASFQTDLLSLSRRVWSDLHTWFSLVVGAGVVIHLALHWSWFVRMTKRLFQLGPDRQPLRSGRAKLFYAIDIFIGFSFILTMLSGVLFLFLGSGGFQGGRNPGFQTTFLGLPRGTWSDLHTWFGLMMGAGVLGHLALHWSWLVSKTKRMFRPQPSGHLAPQPVSIKD